MKKKIVTAPFDRHREPPKQNLFFMPIIWLCCWILTRSGRLKIRKERMEGLKPPFLVLGTHHAFMDFYITPLALFPHRANYVSELEGFENFGEWLYRQAGCLGTRKFVNDLSLVKNIKKVIDRGDILVLYPEARYANVGTSSAFPESVGKLAKFLDVPLVTIHMKGNYLQSPIWNLKKRAGVPLQTTITQLFTREELRAASAQDVNTKLQKALAYDEYKWQYDNRIRIDMERRAEGLELVLYQCPHCGAEFRMKTHGAALFCEACGARWHMTELGQLAATQKAEAADEFLHIPDWYEWQRAQVKSEIDSGQYRLDIIVKIESLPNAKNFIDLGAGRLVHSRDGFDLSFVEYGETTAKTLSFKASALFSIHTEYDYRGKGPCITLSTLDNTYFIFPLESGFNATKIQFATEHMYPSGQAFQSPKAAD